MSSSSISANPSWKDYLTKLSQDIDYQGSYLSSIRNASLNFSTQDMLRFLESDTSLTLLVNNRSEPLIIFHHFKSFNFSFPMQESKLIAIAGIDMAISVVINTSSIKKYSQLAPTFDSFKNVTSINDLQHIETKEALSLQNAIIHHYLLWLQSPKNLTFLLLEELNHLDDHF